MTTDIVLPAPTKKQIMDLQAAMIPLQCELPEPNHWFAPGVYVRQLTVPAGMLIVGKIHKYSTVFIVLQGLAEVISEFGRETVGAGYICVSPPGIKRVALALEETTFLNVHANPTNTQDLELIESEHVVEESLIQIGEV